MLQEAQGGERYLVDGQWLDADATKRACQGPIPRRMSVVLDLIDPGDVLDVGCYAGGFVRAATDRLPASRVAGVDYDPENLRIARLLHPELTERFSQASVYSLPHQDESLDCVTFQEVIEHLEGAATAVKELNRVLRPGGSLIVTTPNAYDWRAALSFMRGELAGRLRRRPRQLVDLVYHGESEWNRHIHCWTPSTLLTLMTQNGFEYETHGFAGDGVGRADRSVERLAPFLAPVLVLKVIKRAPAPDRLI